MCSLRTNSWSLCRVMPATDQRHIAWPLVGFYVSHRLSRHHHHYYQHLGDGHKDFLKDPLPSLGIHLQKLLY